MNTGVPLYLVLLFFFKICTPLKWHLVPQPDDVDRGSYDEPRSDDGHICLRECERGDIARICYYRFYLEEHSVLSSDCGSCPESQSDCLNPGCVIANAYQQPILTVNRRLPGPSIQVCKGDKVTVEIVNKIPASNVTIHWHGLKHLGAPGTPWMDGVPYVTQCPVFFNQTFQYDFVPGESGTFLWRSYNGAQQLKGLVGSVVVREPHSSDDLRLFYDHDIPSHIILVQDWVLQMAEDNSIKAALTNQGRTAYGEQVPDVYLINGRGIGLLPNFKNYKQYPITEFYVRHGFRYRFRVIGGTSLTCPFRLTIQGHQLLVISADINPVKPVLVDSLIVSSGERYDVVLNATEPVCTYWVIVEGVGDCKMAAQVALLRYHGCTLDNLTLPLNLAPGIPSTEDRYTLNPETGDLPEGSLGRGISAGQLTSPSPVYLRLTRSPDIRLLVMLGSEASGNEGMEFDPYSRLPLTPGMPNNSVTKHVPLNAVFEILIINTRTTNMSLSCHIHGHDFYIVEQGRLPDSSLSVTLHDLQIRLADKKSASRFMPSKDTVAVSDGGYTLVRVLSDNPGFWILECLSDPKVSATFQVGHLSDIPPLPADFPTCQGFQPHSTDILTM